MGRRTPSSCEGAGTVNTEEMLPQLQQVARDIVRKASHRDEAADEATAYIMAKVAEVLAEFESGARARPATNMSGYMYRAMENALIDWQRQQEKASPLTEGERAWIGREAEGHELRGGFRAFYPKMPPAAPTAAKRPYLMRLIHIAAQGQYDSALRRRPPDRLRDALLAALDDISCRSDAERMIDQAEKRIAQLPARAGQATRLYLQNVRQAEIARRLGITRGAVSQLLDRTCQHWGWDEQRVEVERLALLFAHLFMTVESALRPFRPSEDSGDGEDLGAPVERDGDLEWVLRQRRRNLAEEMHVLLGGPGQRGPDALQVAYRRARESAVLKAIASHPWLRAWTRAMETDYIPDLIEFAEDHYMASWEA